MLKQPVVTKLLSFKRILVGYSGGLDSTVLLHLLKTHPQLNAKPLLAVHVNHALSPNAGVWQEHCQAFCRELGIKCIAKTIYIDKASGESLENLARQGRYEVFAALMKKGDVLLTGHHQNDQAETLLLQLCRGAGVKGMAAMPESKPFASGTLLRPLLDFCRTELATYAQQQHLKWIEDESNTDTNFDRNYLRHEILPLLQKKWPNAVANIARSATHHAQAQTILNLQAAQDLLQAQVKVDQLAIDCIKKFSLARQKNLLRYWIEHNNFVLPSDAILQQIIQQGLYAKTDANPCVTWDHAEIRRYENNLYIMSVLLPFDHTQIISWQNQYILPETKSLMGKLTIRYRQGGECFHPANRHKSQTLKKLMQEWKIPTWMRDRTPLLYQDDKLIAVIGYAVAKEIA